MQGLTLLSLSFLVAGIGILWFGSEGIAPAVASTFECYIMLGSAEAPHALCSTFRPLPSGARWCPYTELRRLPRGTAPQLLSVFVRPTPVSPHPPTNQPPLPSPSLSILYARSCVHCLHVLLHTRAQMCPCYTHHRCMYNAIMMPGKRRRAKRLSKHLQRSQ